MTHRLGEPSYFSSLPLLNPGWLPFILSQPGHSAVNSRLHSPVSVPSPHHSPFMLEAPSCASLLSVTCHRDASTSQPLAHSYHSPTHDIPLASFSCFWKVTSAPMCFSGTGHRGLCSPRLHIVRSVACLPFPCRQYPDIMSPMCPLLLLNPSPSQGMAPGDPAASREAPLHFILKL